jgi:chromosome segregation ATPase
VQREFVQVTFKGRRAGNEHEFYSRHPDSGEEICPQFIGIVLRKKYTLRITREKKEDYWAGYNVEDDFSDLDDLRKEVETLEDEGLELDSARTALKSEIEDHRALRKEVETLEDEKQGLREELDHALAAIKKLNDRNWWQRLRKR